MPSSSFSTAVSGRYNSSMRSRSRAGDARCIRMERPVTKARVRSQSRSWGSAVAMSSMESVSCNGTMRYFLASDSETASRAGADTRVKSATFMRKRDERALSSMSSVTKPRPTAVSQRLSCVSCRSSSNAFASTSPSSVGRSQSSRVGRMDISVRTPVKVASTSSGKIAMGERTDQLNMATSDWPSLRFVFARE